MKTRVLSNIILIEDNPTDADLTLRALRTNNYDQNTVHFENGDEAINFIKNAAVNSLRLILLDLKLCGMDGKGILQEIKTNDKTKIVPVVILSSSNQQRDVEECFRCGANAYIVKPVEFKNYISVVSSTVTFWMEINYMPVEFS